jgi:hypothetical protein
VNTPGVSTRERDGMAISSQQPESFHVRLGGVGGRQQVRVAVLPPTGRSGVDHLTLQGFVPVVATDRDLARLGLLCHWDK